MSILVFGMLASGVAALAAGLYCVQPKIRAASGFDKILVSGPIFEAVALAMFAAEHFLAAHDLSALVPCWLPGALFWTYFMGAALLAASISFILSRYVRLSASLLALFFLIIVATIDLPNLPKHVHERLFWTLTARETSFAGGAMVLAGSIWPQGRVARDTLMIVGRLFVECTLLFYAVEHFLFPRFVPGVPLMKLTPAWVPAPVALALVIGTALFSEGIALMFRSARRTAAATTGAILLALTLFFYVPILITELRSPLAVEGINYVGDSLLFAATALLAGLGNQDPELRELTRR